MTKKSIFVAVVAVGSLLVAASPFTARGDVPKKVTPRNVTATPPEGFVQVGNTDLYYHTKPYGLAVVGKIGSSYYSTTIVNNGFSVAMQVGDGTPIRVDSSEGSIVDGVSCSASIEQQGELGRIIYTVTNSNDEDVKVSLGTYADLTIGNNSKPTISRRTDSCGNTYGLTIKDGENAQFCLLFGYGLSGVTYTDDYWFGHSATLTEPEDMINYHIGRTNWMEENVAYDCGMGFCWKNRVIPANSSVEFSYLVGVGDVNLQPTSDFEVMVNDPDNWNDLSISHQLTIQGSYENPRGVSGKIQYAVEDSEEWLDLTEELESGASFNASLVATFDQNKATHVIRFRTIDTVGNTSMLAPISYKDVRLGYNVLHGLENAVYNWGEPITFSDSQISCSLATGEYSTGNYKNNINVGTASFDLEGVYPYSIGKQQFNFTINPLPLTGGINLEQTEFDYNYSQQVPGWSFTYEPYNEKLVAGKDYRVELWGTRDPGISKIIVYGMGNFTGSLAADYVIKKAPLPDVYAFYNLPDEDITFDNQPHAAIATVYDWHFGATTIYYAHSGQDDFTTEPPVAPGSYDVYVEIAESEYYLGKPKEKIHTFTIYELDADDWTAVQNLYNAIKDHIYATWDLSEGPACVPGLLDPYYCGSYDKAFKTKEGKIVGLDIKGSHLYSPLPLEIFQFKNLTSLNIREALCEGDADSLASYLSNHPDVTENISELDISSNSFTGNLSTLVACFPNLKSLDASFCQFSEVNPMIPESVENLNIRGQSLDWSLVWNLSTSSKEEIFNQIPSVLTYDHQARNYSRALQFECSAEDGFSIFFDYIDGEMIVESLSTRDTYFGENGEMMSAKVWDYNTGDWLSMIQSQFFFSSGDSNFDGDVNVLDLQSSVLYAFNDYNRAFNFTAADTYRDEQINIQDIICTANILLAQDLSGSEMMRRKARAAQQENADAFLFVENGKLYLYSETPVAALDIRLDGFAKWNIENYGLSNVSTPNHLVGYSMSGMTLPTGLVEIADVENCNGIIDCVLSDSRANSISVSTNVQSGIDMINAADGEEGIIFNTSGHRVRSSANGVKIIITDKGVKKVLN